MVARIEDGAVLLDLRAIPVEDDARLGDAIERALAEPLGVG